MKPYSRPNENKLIKTEVRDTLICSVFSLHKRIGNICPYRIAVADPRYYGVKRISALPIFVDAVPVYRRYFPIFRQIFLTVRQPVPMAGPVGRSTGYEPDHKTCGFLLPLDWLQNSCKNRMLLLNIKNLKVTWTNFWSIANKLSVFSDSNLDPPHTPHTPVSSPPSSFSHGKRHYGSRVLLKVTTKWTSATCLQSERGVLDVPTPARLKIWKHC